MKKICLVILAGLILFAGPAMAEEINSLKSLSEWYTYYYSHPAPNKVIEAIEYYGNSELFYKESSRSQFAYFIGMILRENETYTLKAFDALRKKDENSQFIYLNALWFMDTELGKDFLDKAAREWDAKEVREAAAWLRKTPVPQVLYMSIDSPAQLDLLWSHFLATGSKEPVKKIISTLKRADQGSTNILIAGAAQWSLTSNAKQHKRVMKICEEEYRNSEEGLLKEKLKEIIAEATPPKEVEGSM